MIEIFLCGFGWAMLGLTASLIEDYKNYKCTKKYDMTSDYSSFLDFYLDESEGRFILKVLISLVFGPFMFLILL